MAAQELRWPTYLLTDLGESPRSPPVLYVDNKAMLALCREQRLEHRTKHIALRYFLVIISASALSWVFLLCFPLLDWSCDPLFSPTLPMGVRTSAKIDNLRLQCWQTARSATLADYSAGALASHSAALADFALARCCMPF
ncbi:unnamed protein product [Closterium sp. NIES-53]